MFRNPLYLVTGFILLVAFSYCSPQQTKLADRYRGVLQSPGGELAFLIHINQNDSEINGFVVNGADTSHFSSVELKHDSLIFNFSHYDSHIRSVIQKDGSLNGAFQKRTSSGYSTPMEFSAYPGGNRYAVGLDSETKSPFEGEWDVDFTSDAGKEFPATGVFYSKDGTLFGTFITETGDYRFLEGFSTDSSFTLSVFDGSHAFIFKGKMIDDRVEGDFWSGPEYHAVFSAERGASDLEDPYSIAELTEKKISFSFSDTEGNLVSHTDEKFREKPVLLYLFGSWCPNCADEARMLKSFYEEEYKNTDLEIVGLAFEYSGNFESDAEMVERYRQRFSIPWTLLVAGNSDKSSASEQLSFIKEVTSYPTAFFADRDHTIRFVHVGFKGPGTGSYYIQEKEQFKQHLDTIIYD